MWYRDEQLAAFRIAELRAEADRWRDTQEPGARPPAHAATRTLRQVIALLAFFAGRGAIAVSRTFDSATASSEVPDGRFGTRQSR
jgi:hypothetical protein